MTHRILFRPTWLLIAIGLLPTFIQATAEVYELRTYTCNEGKLDDLHDRFRNHTVALFAKHGMESVGYWVPMDGPEAENTLIYILKHESRESARASFAAFGADPEWQAVFRASEADGPVLARPPRSQFMELADYSPAFETGAGDAVFELRTYTPAEGKLDALDARFRDHTIGLLGRHDMTPILFCHTFPRRNAEPQLVYILRHESRDAAKANWRAFGSDKEWRTARKESEKGGSLTATLPEFIYLTATDYSPMK